MPVIASTVIAGSVTVVNGTFALVQTGYKLAAVDEDLQLCLQLLADADKDLNHARRQISSSKSGQNQTYISPTDLEYFESAVEMMASATLNLGKLVQHYRVQQDVNNKISMISRFKWVLQGKDKFANHQAVLTMAHSRLMAVIVRLGAFQSGYQNSSISPPPPPYFSRLASEPPKILRSPSQQRALEGKNAVILRTEGISEGPRSSAQGRQTRPTLPSVPSRSWSSHSLYDPFAGSTSEKSDLQSYR